MRWDYDCTNAEVFDVDTDDTICEVWEADGGDLDKIGNQIAAVPELLALARAVVNWDGTPEYWHTMAVAALAKAGEEPCSRG